MFFEPTAIHYDEQARFSSTNSCMFVYDPFLRLDSFGATSNSLFTDRKNVFRLSEDIHKMDCAGHGGK
jgi:hypothetical protein